MYLHKSSVVVVLLSLLTVSSASAYADSASDRTNADIDRESRNDRYVPNLIERQFEKELETTRCTADDVRRGICSRESKVKKKLHEDR